MEDLAPTYDKDLANLFQVEHMELFGLHPQALKPFAFLWSLLDHFFFFNSTMSLIF